MRDVSATGRYSFRQRVYLFCLLILSYSSFTLSCLYFILIVFLIIFIYYIPRVYIQNTKKTKHCQCDQLSTIKNFLISLPRQTQKFLKQLLGDLNKKNCSLMIDKLTRRDEGTFHFRIIMEAYTVFSYSKNKISVSVIGKRGKGGSNCVCILLSSKWPVECNIYFDLSLKPL
uniref:Transmembrane protein n=1 Tax=Haplochromis burtoni TaxID=8153 RepID=A0A3Q2VKU0_HAPBU